MLVRINSLCNRLPHICLSMIDICCLYIQGLSISRVLYVYISCRFSMVTIISVVFLIVSHISHPSPWSLLVRLCTVWDIQLTIKLIEKWTLVLLLLRWLRNVLLVVIMQFIFYLECTCSILSANNSASKYLVSWRHKMTTCWASLTWPTIWSYFDSTCFSWAKNVTLVSILFDDPFFPFDKYWPTFR